MDTIVEHRLLHQAARLMFRVIGWLAVSCLVALVVWFMGRRAEGGYPAQGPIERVTPGGSAPVGVDEPADPLVVVPSVRAEGVVRLEGLGPESVDLAEGDPAVGDPVVEGPVVEPRRVSGQRLYAQLFEHPDGHAGGPGKIWDLGPGLTTAGSVFDNDSASSARVPEGVTMTLYVDGNGGGRRVVLPAGTHDLDSMGFGDNVSSVRVASVGAFDPATPRGPKDAVQLHQHLPREGDLGEAWSLRLTGSRTTQLFRAADGHFLDREASAAWVPSGYEVTLFRNANGLGPALVLGPGFHELLPFDFNDATSSARVRRTP